MVLSFIFLSYTQTKQQSPQSQDWWVVYFSNPKNDSLDFTIENNSNQTSFHYAILSDKNKIDEKDVAIDKGAKKEISVENKPAFAEATAGRKITIRVNTGDDIKEIYKTFE